MLRFNVVTRCAFVAGTSWRIVAIRPIDRNGLRNGHRRHGIEHAAFNQDELELDRFGLVYPVKQKRHR